MRQRVRTRYGCCGGVVKRAGAHVVENLEQRLFISPAILGNVDALAGRRALRLRGGEFVGVEWDASQESFADGEFGRLVACCLDGQERQTVRRGRCAVRGGVSEFRASSFRRIP